MYGPRNSLWIPGREQKVGQALALGSLNPLTIMHFAVQEHSTESLIWSSPRPQRPASIGLSTYRNVPSRLPDAPILHGLYCF